VAQGKGLAESHLSAILRDNALCNIEQPRYGQIADIDIDEKRSCVSSTARIIQALLLFELF
jgi:hypothetical protein